MRLAPLLLRLGFLNTIRINTEVNEMEIKQRLIPTQYTNIRPGIPMTPEFITVHETANTAKGADAEAHARLLECGNTRTASWHFTVDDHEVIQHIPTNEVAWHAGDGRNGTGNRKSISIEICVNADGDFNKAKANAVELIRFLMKKYNIPISRVVPHHHWTGKDCPHNILPHWKEFIDQIQNEPAQAAQVEDMYDLSYLVGDEFKGLQSTRHPEEMYPKVKWAMDAHAQCVLLVRRDFDLRVLQSALNKMFPDNK